VPWPAFLFQKGNGISATTVVPSPGSCTIPAFVPTLPSPLGRAARRTFFTSSRLARVTGSLTSSSPRTLRPIASGLHPPIYWGLHPIAAQASPFIVIDKSQYLP
jgi:hypothetical protein